MVAPLVGAWIEILFDHDIYAVLYVAPLVGAWIEIHIVFSYLLSVFVAPLVGAWIEIPFRTLSPRCHRSLLSWERGLKFAKATATADKGESLLSWERGLKSLYATTILSRLLSLLSWERGLKSLTLLFALLPLRRSSRGSVD